MYWNSSLGHVVAEPPAVHHTFSPMPEAGLVLVLAAQVVLRKNELFVHDLEHEVAPVWKSTSTLDAFTDRRTKGSRITGWESACTAGRWKHDL